MLIRRFHYVEMIHGNGVTDSYEIQLKEYEDFAHFPGDFIRFNRWVYRWVIYISIINCASYQPLFGTY